MNLSNFTDYSLRTLIYLTTYKDRLCTAKEVSHHFDISHNHIVKIVHNLAKAGYIHTQKGKGGGITLAVAPKDINLGALISELESNLDIAECFNCSKNTCNIVTVCKLKNILFDAYSAFINELNRYTLADITSNKSELLALFDTKAASSD